MWMWMWLTFNFSHFDLPRLLVLEDCAKVALLYQVGGFFVGHNGGC